jgi:hypothetical protein
VVVQMLRLHRLPVLQLLHQQRGEHPPRARCGERSRRPPTRRVVHLAGYNNTRELHFAVHGV